MGEDEEGQHYYLQPLFGYIKMVNVTISLIQMKVIIYERHVKCNLILSNNIYDIVSTLINKNPSGLYQEEKIASLFLDFSNSNNFIIKYESLTIWNLITKYYQFSSILN